MAQFSNAVLHLRLVNARDADAQSMVQLTPANAHLYNYPPQPLKRHEGLGAHESAIGMSAPINQRAAPPPVLPPPSVPPPPSARRDGDDTDRAVETVPREHPLMFDSEADERQLEPRDLDGIDSERTIGFQVSLRDC